MYIIKINTSSIFIRRTDGKPEVIENLRYKTIFTSVDQNTSEFYCYHILLTMICIFRTECELKPRYVAFHVTENGKFF